MDPQRHRKRTIPTDNAIRANLAAVGRYRHAFGASLMKVETEGEFASFSRL
jgi:hypothetical protein